MQKEGEKRTQVLGGWGGIQLTLAFKGTQREEACGQVHQPGRRSASGRPGGEGISGTRAGDRDHAKELGGQIHAGPGLKGSGDSGHPLSVEARRQPVESGGQGFSNFLS